MIKKSLSISDLEIYDLNLETSVRNDERENFTKSRCIHYRGSHPTDKWFKQHIK